MNLTLGDVPRLPLAAALLEGEDVLAATPEWHGAEMGTVTYPVRRTRLLVAPLHGDAAPQSVALLDALLQSLDAAARAARNWDALQLRMVAASLRVLAGRRVSGSGVASDVVEMTVAGIGRRTGLQVEVGSVGSLRVPAVEVVALVLVQLAANAERHDAATSVRIEASSSGFQLTWQGRPEPVRTSRSRAQRQRWGLGFARIAADHLGALLHPPSTAADDSVMATLELGVQRLALPLAAVRGGQVLRATRSWDEETALPPGSDVHRSAHLDDLLAAARARAGGVTERSGFAARAAGDVVWLALPPDPPIERARDVLTGLSHEQALLRGADRVHHAVIRGLAVLLAAQLGMAPPRAPAAVWRERVRTLLAADGVALDVPAFAGIGALDPDATFVIARRGGERFEVDGDRLWLRLSDGARDDPVARCLALPAGDRVPLG